jgi:hypothetical protein
MLEVQNVKAVQPLHSVQIVNPEAYNEIYSRQDAKHKFGFFLSFAAFASLREIFRDKLVREAHPTKTFVPFVPSW